MAGRIYVRDAATKQERTDHPMHGRALEGTGANPIVQGRQVRNAHMYVYTFATKDERQRNHCVGQRLLADPENPIQAKLWWGPKSVEMVWILESDGTEHTGRDWYMTREDFLRVSDLQARGQMRREKCEQEKDRTDEQLEADIRAEMAYEQEMGY